MSCFTFKHFKHLVGDGGGVMWKYSNNYARSHSLGWLSAEIS